MNAGSLVIAHNHQSPLVGLIVGADYHVIDILWHNCHWPLSYTREFVTYKIYINTWEFIE